MACEVTAERVVAARAGQRCAVAGGGERAGPGAREPDSGSAAGERGGAGSAGRRRCAKRSAPVAGRSRDITLVIPDASTRIMLLDFDTLPEKPEDADAVVRFRLKKSLPFDVDASAVSFDRQRRRTAACGW